MVLPFAFLKESKYPYLIFIVATLGFEIGALYYQYALDYGPCTLCVQIRATLFLILFLGILGWLSSSRKSSASVRRLLAGLLALSAAFFLYQSYLVLGIERLWFESTCTFEAPFPNWLPLHELIPVLFEPWELCGYTPEIILGITMAETLFIAALGYLGLALWLVYQEFRVQS